MWFWIIVGIVAFDILLASYFFYKNLSYRDKLWRKRVKKLHEEHRKKRRKYFAGLGIDTDKQNDDEEEE